MSEHQGTFSAPFNPGNGSPHAQTIQQQRVLGRRDEVKRIWKRPGPQLMLTTRELKASPQEQQMALSYRSHRYRAQSLPPGSARTANVGVSQAYPSPGPEFDASRMRLSMEHSDLPPGPPPPGYGWELQVSYGPPPYSPPTSAPFVSADQRSGSMRFPSVSRRSSVASPGGLGAPALGPAPSFSSPQRASSVHYSNPGPHVSRHTSGTSSPAMSLQRPSRSVASASGYSPHINRSPSSPVTAGSPLARSGTIRSPTRSSLGYAHPFAQASSMLDESRQTSSPEPDSDHDDGARSTSLRRSLPPTTPPGSLLFGTLTPSSSRSSEVHHERPKRKKLQKKTRKRDML